jgi:cytochrome c-type biogenesis protein CcmH
MDERRDAPMGRRAFLGAGLALVILRPGQVSAVSSAARPSLAPSAGDSLAPSVQDSLASSAQDSHRPSDEDSLPGRGEIGTLRDPSVVGRPRLPTDPEENAAEIQAIELRLACNCGCTLDVFTCRTTDFSCTYSPKLHREVLALRNQGKSAQQVIDAFVEKYGEKALMAPKPAGFNLAGYLVPGAAIATAGVALVLLISRRRAAVASPAALGLSAPPVAASTEEMDRLRRALDEVED